jgi:uncharacterized membrane protein YciS (DUF1049 family)
MTDQQQIGEHVIRINPNRVDYTITDYELDSISEAGQNSWKDFFLVFISSAIPLLINGIPEINLDENFTLSLELFLNLLIGGISFIAAIICGILWLKTKKNLSEIIEKIKSKPEYAAQFSESSGGDSVVLLEHENNGVDEQVEDIEEAEEPEQ